MTTTAIDPRPTPPLIPLAPPQGLIWDRLPVVADASTLINDCLRFAKHGREPLLLAFSRGFPLVSLYATERVRLEVEERLPDAAERGRLPLEDVESAWRDHYEPAIRFVPLDPLPSRDPRVAILAATDPDDLPTASLAELIGPCLVVSGDRWTSDRGTRNRADLRSLIGEAASRLGPFITRAFECHELLERAAFVPEGPVSELAVVVRAVATAPHPPRTSEVAGRAGLSTQKVAAILRKPIFTRTEDGCYLLGWSVAVGEAS